MIQLSEEQLIYIVQTLGKLDERSEKLEKAVLGNGQPGLAQRVDSLENSRSQLWGAGAVVTAIGGAFEWLLHMGGHK